MAMCQYRIRGGTRIAGDICIAGAKNAALPVLAALCLNQSECEIRNCPPISDVLATIEILKAVGCDVEYTGDILKVDSRNISNHNIPDEIVSKMRSSILFMGAMLARCGKVNIAMPGGCELGARSIDFHLAGFTAMGAKICMEGGKFECTAPELIGTRIKLPIASVGATQNLMLAAVCAKGETVILNAAREPEIVSLASFLISMGAEIDGAGTSMLVIKGVDAASLKASKPFSIMPDRIVAGTYLVATAMTGGIITLHNIVPQDLASIITPLSEMGCTITSGKNCVTLAAPERLRALPRLITEVHPGFPTDMQAQFIAALATASGTSTVIETIFESRYAHAFELNKMGADINLSRDNRTFTINGKMALRGCEVEAHDLRGGAALILAGLVAQGETIVTGARHIRRGYAGIEHDLAALGADIVVESGCGN